MALRFHRLFWPTLGLTALCALGSIGAAEAKTFRWANDGDANSMSTLGHGRPSWGAGPPPSL